MKAIERLESCPQTRLVVKESLLEAALAEAATLKPHLKQLNAGQRGRGDLTSIRGIAYFNPDGQTAAPAVDELRESAEAVYDWLMTPSSKLRALLVFMSSGGVFFSAHCHEKVMRAFISCGGGGKVALLPLPFTLHG